MSVTEERAAMTAPGRTGEVMAGRQIASIAGVLSALLLLISFFVAPAAPSRGASTIRIVTYYIDNHTGVLLAGYLAGFSILFFFFFLGGLRSYLQAAEGNGGALAGAVNVAGSTYAALALLATAVTLAAVFKVARQADPVLIRALYDLNHMVLHLIWFPVAALVGGTALLSLLTRRFHAWHSWLGVVTAAVALVAAGGLFADTSNLVTSLSEVGFLLFTLWILLTSVLLYRG